MFLALQGTSQGSEGGMKKYCVIALLGTMHVCTHKGDSLNLDLMISNNYVVNMIMLMSICIYMYVCLYIISDKVIMDHDYSMLMFICTYVCMYVID